MTKNDSVQLSDIEKRKQELESELEGVHAQIQKLDNMRVQLTAQGNAINGAIQQCDLFLQQLNGGDESNITSSIPSEPKKKKGSNSVASAVMS